MQLLKKKKLTSFQIIIVGFACVILVGTLLLTLPISSKNRQFTPLLDALFTSVSAVCVTGLVVYDTAVHWSLFGQGVILALIQVGGMGVVTVTASFALISGRRISLIQRSTMQEALSAHKMGGIVRMTGFIVKITLLTELAGAILMMPVFCRDYGSKGVWMAVFHSVSAFCNAGFDILGTTDAPFVSLTRYADNFLINIAVVSLIVFGGIGFLTWDDIRANRLNFKRYRMQSKVILAVTAFLVFGGALFFYLTDFADRSLPEGLLLSLFQSVTPRTAGFNTADLNAMSDTSVSLLTILMLIGGAPGSTAGGMKVTTVAVMFASIRAAICRDDHIHFFGRRIENSTLKNSVAVFMLYLSLSIGGAFAISLIEALPVQVCLFETASAIGTVGLTLGITHQLSSISQMILIVLMFFGRVGGLTLIYAALSETRGSVSKLPQDKLTVG